MAAASAKALAKETGAASGDVVGAAAARLARQATAEMKMERILNRSGTDGGRRESTDGLSLEFFSL